ncbi:MAG: hypothetical protein AAGI22_07820 [Planctomycetota bacterium]
MRSRRTSLCRPGLCRLLPALTALVAPALALDATSTSRVSVGPGGAQANGGSGGGFGRTISVSDSGRFVAFTSEATNLVAGDTNNEQDVFLRDREAGTTVRCSVGGSGQQGNGRCENVTVSNDGRFVAYSSRSTNLVPGDTNATWDIFLWDATTGTSSLLSRGMGGSPGNGESYWPSMDEDGDRIVFESEATDLVPGDANGFQDIFVYRRTTDSIAIVSVADNEDPATGDSSTPSISRDGRLVAFASRSRFDPLDPNTLTDVYVRDLVADTTELTPSQSGGFNVDLTEPSISTGGRYVAFQSRASNIPGGSNDGRWDVYRYDRQTDTTVLVSRATDGTDANLDAFIGGMSFDGAWITFVTRSTTLAPGLTNALRCYVRRVDQEWTERVSVSDAGTDLVGINSEPTIAGDGRFICFRTDQPNAVPGDTNLAFDIMVRDRGFGTRSAGGTYCNSTANSSGQPSELTVGGTNKLVDQSLVLVAEFLPANSLGYFLFSETPGNVLGFGGSQGRLCLGGSIFRLSNFVQSSGGNGVVTLPLPFGQLPPAAMLAVGDTWNFQYWFRDAVGGTATSNTSSAVCVPLY